MRLPKSWNDITIGQFQECYFILKERSIDSWIKVISVLSGLTVAELENIPTRKLKIYIYQLQFLLTPNLNTKVKQFIYVKGGLYKAIYKPSDLNTAQVNDVKNFIKGSPDQYYDTVVKNAHMILASLYWKLSWKGFKYNSSNHAMVSESFKCVKMGEVYGTLFFYSKVFNQLINPSLDFLKENQEILKEHMTEVENWLTDFATNGAGK